MPTPRSKWWTARSTIDEPGDAVCKGRFKNLCDLLCERYWRDGCKPEDLRTQTLDMNAIRRVVQCQARPVRCTQLFLEMVKGVQQWRSLVAMQVAPIRDRSGYIGCTLEWPNAAEYLGLNYRHPAPPPAQDSAQPSSPQNQTRPDQTSSESEEEQKGVLDSESEGNGTADLKLPPDSRHTVTRWLQGRGYRVSDSSVSNLFRARMDQWSTNVRPYSVGAVFMAWVQKQEREGELTKLVKECGGDSVKGEIEEIMRGRIQ